MSCIYFSGNDSCYFTATAKQLILKINLTTLKLKKVLQQPWLFLVMLILPIAFTFLMGNMNVEGNKKINLIIVDEDKSYYSAEIDKTVQS